MRDQQPQFPLSFGAQLRARRLAAGWSLGRLARLVHYSPGHLSKLENGRKWPSEALVRRCDALLEAAGALVAAWRAEWPPASASSASSAGSAGDDPRLGQLIGLSVLSLVASEDTPRWVDPQAVVSYRTTFDQLRERGQFLRPSDLLPTLMSETRALTGLAGGAQTAVARELLRLAARFAEYAGWMAQEAGLDEQAVALTERAVGLASRAGEDLTAYRLVRLADVALYAGDAAATIGLSAAALRISTDTRVSGIAAQRLAHGHALANDWDACLRALDRAGEFLSRDTDGGTAQPVIGSTTVADHVAMALGWCLLELGEPERAAPILAAEVARLPGGAHRARARYTVRLARCYAELGEADLACRTAEPVLRRLVTLQSATVGTDVTRLATTLRRFRTRESVRVLQPLLAEASPARLRRRTGRSGANGQRETRARGSANRAPSDQAPAGLPSVSPPG